MDYFSRNEKRLNTMKSFLCVLLLSLSAAQEQKILTAEPGENITLTCRAPNKGLTGVEWRREDLIPEYVLLYRDDQFDPEEQHPSYKNRVDLQDRQMKDGDVSLILKDVTAADEGTYECRALTPGRKRFRRASETVNFITLRVADPPGPTGGSAGLIAGVAVFVVLAAAAAAAGFVIYRRRTRNQNQGSPQPSSVELLPLETV